MDLFSVGTALQLAQKTNARIAVEERPFRAALVA
jgi:hypothetical protein